MAPLLLLLLLSLAGARTVASSHLLHVAPYGDNAVRVRLFAHQPTAVALSNPGYLLPAPAAASESPPADRGGAWLRSGVAVSSGNIEVVSSGAGGFTVRRISDGAPLLSAQSGALAAGTPSADGRAQLNASLGVAIGAGLRFYGGGCRCGGGYNRADGHDGGDMTNPGRNASADLSFGVPIGLAPSPHIPGMTGGLGSQCGMMNGMPWVVAASVSSGVEFGLFVNTQGWTYGTASASRQTVELYATRTYAVDVVVTTWPAGASATGSSRASAIQGWYADALGHVPVMSREVVGYWHSKDSIGSQSEAESIVAGFADRGIHVDVLVLDYMYKTCDGCTAFNSKFPDPKGMVANFKQNGTHVMAHVNVEQNFSDPTFVGGRAFLENKWTTMQRTSEGKLVPLCRSGVGHLMPGQPLPVSDYDNTTCRYDPFIPEARAALWKSVNETLVAAGVHMFWLDGDEIIGEDPWETPTAPLGPQVWAGDHDSYSVASSSMGVRREDPGAGADTCPANCDKSLPTANCPLIGVDYNGGDIDHANAANATECCLLCHGHPACKYWTFTGGVCWMKATIQHKMTNQKDHVSGSGTCDLKCCSKLPPPPPPPPPPNLNCTSTGRNCPTVFMAGMNDEVGTFFPFYHQLPFAEGIAREKLPPPAMTLSRATTAGSWRLGGASWDGDHHCAWSDYINHLYDTLDGQLSGQLWWSVDVGGFFCQMDDETLARDFMLSSTAPIMRQHGARDTRIWGPGWSKVATNAATKAIQLRVALGDYIHEQLAIASATGVPLNRYLWHDFPEDSATFDVQDEFMFGSDYLVAPVVVQNTLSRSVYFPKGASWMHYKTGQVHEGGSSATVTVPLDELAMFKRTDAKSPFVRQKATMHLQ